LIIFKFLESFSLIILKKYIRSGMVRVDDNDVKELNVSKNGYRGRPPL